jgi:hypothetical protein
MNINRRDFLSLTTCCCGGFLLAGCSLLQLQEDNNLQYCQSLMINSQAIGAYKQVKEKAKLIQDKDQLGSNCFCWSKN